MNNINSDCSTNDESIIIKTTKRKPPAHAFQAGNKLGKGRPAGSKSYAQIALEEIGQENAQAILNKMIECALEGDVAAGKILLDRFRPLRKGYPVHIDLPAIKTIGELMEANSIIIQQMGQGKLTSEETLGVQSALDYTRKLIETKELHVMVDELKIRLEAIEGKG